MIFAAMSRWKRFFRTFDTEQARNNSTLLSFLLDGRFRLFSGTIDLERFLRADVATGINERKIQ